MRAFTEYHLINLITNPKTTIMVKINPFLKSLLEKESLSMDAVLDLISQVTDSTEDVIRIMSYLCGHGLPILFPRYISYDETEADYHFISYDILTNKVYYKGSRLQTRYVATQEEADEVKLKEYYTHDAYPGSYYKNNNCSIATTIKVLVEKESMSLDDWNKHACE